MYIKPYFQRELSAPLPDSPGDIAEYPTQLAPTIIEAIITRSARTFWKSDLDYERGLNAINQYCIEVLMGAKKDLIKEIRSMRGDFYGSVQNIDPDVVGIGMYAGASINDVLLSLSQDNEEKTVREALAEQTALLIQIRDGGGTAEDFTNIIAKLTQIATLLA